jgi:hypothetical protein
MKSESARAFAGLSGILLLGGTIDTLAKLEPLSSTFGEDGAAYLLLFLAVVSFVVSQILEDGYKARVAEDERKRAARAAAERERESRSAGLLDNLKLRDS